VGECFFCYRPTQVVSDKGPLNGCGYVFVLTVCSNWCSVGELAFINKIRLSNVPTQDWALHTCREAKHNEAETKRD